MNIFHVWRDYSHNLFDHTNDLCNRNGIDSRIICLNEVNGSGLNLNNPVISVNSLSPAEISTPTLARRFFSKIFQKYNKRAWLRLILKCSDETPPDLLHFHFGFSFTEIGYQDEWDKIPIIISFYGVDAGKELLRKNAIHEYKKLFNRGNFLFLCLSNEVSQRLIKIGCPERNIRVFDLPVDLDLIPFLPFLGSRNPFNVLMPARFIEKKGHKYALKALKKLIEAGHELTLTIFGYGFDGWLIEMIGELGLVGNVRLINNNLSPNFLEQYIRYLKDADLVISPSVESRNGDDEAGPALTIVMAQAASKAVIVSNFAGHERSVIHLETGLVVPMYDADALEKSIEILLNSPDLRKALGENSSAYVRKNFSKKIFFSNLKACYQELVYE